MQYDKKLYNPDIHELHNAICVKQPYANLMVSKESEDAEGNTYAIKSIDIRSNYTKYRGNVIICSTSKNVPNLLSNAIVGEAELYDVKPANELTDEEWNCTKLEKGSIDKIKKSKANAWFFRNPHRIIELPVKGYKGLWDLCITKGDIVEYPEVLNLDKKDWKAFRKYGKKLKNNH